MKKLIVALIVLSPVLCLGQSNVIIPFNGAPTGACAPVLAAVNTATGDFYDCPTNTWNLVSGGGGPPTGVAGGSLSGTYPNPGIANNAVTTATINALAVTTAKIAASAVTSAKVDSSVCSNASCTQNTSGTAANLSGTPTLPTVTLGGGASVPSGQTLTIQSGATLTCAAGSTCPSGSGTVTVVGAGSLTSTAFVTGGGTTTIQTPNANSKLDSSGNATFAGNLTAGSASSGNPSYITFTGGTSGQAGIGAAAVAGTPSTLLLPTTDGTNGQTLLSGTPSGGLNQLTWGSASGSGTVNSGTATHLGYYATSTNAISDAGADFTFNGTHTWAFGSSAIFSLTGLAGGGQFLVPSTTSATSSSTMQLVNDTLNNNNHFWNGTRDLIALGAVAASIPATNTVLKLNKQTGVELQAVASSMVDNGGVTVGSPTGGAQGAGTINATGVYVNGVAVATGGSPGGSQYADQANNGSSGFQGIGVPTTTDPQVSAQVSGAYTTKMRPCVWGQVMLSNCKMVTLHLYAPAADNTWYGLASDNTSDNTGTCSNSSAYYCPPAGRIAIVTAYVYQSIAGASTLQLAEDASGASGAACAQTSATLYPMYYHSSGTSGSAAIGYIVPQYHCIATLVGTHNSTQLIQVQVLEADSTSAVAFGHVTGGSSTGAQTLYSAPLSTHALLLNASGTISGGGLNCNAFGATSTTATLNYIPAGGAAEAVGVTGAMTSTNSSVNASGGLYSTGSQQASYTITYSASNANNLVNCYLAFLTDTGTH